MARILEAENLVKSFGGLRAMNNVSMHADLGESVGIIGPNGAGKTTLLNLLTREIVPDTGKVFLDGECIDTQAPFQRVQSGLSRTYQVPRPFSDLAIKENIRVGMMPDLIADMLMEGPDEDAEREIAHSIGIDDEQMGLYPYELPMGDLRRLELARALATDPKVLLLDEVFAGLTYSEINQISELLTERKKTHQTTYVIVSHDLKALEPLVDRVIVIHFGEVLTVGTFREVVHNKDVQVAYLGTSWESA